MTRRRQFSSRDLLRRIRLPLVAALVFVLATIANGEWQQACWREAHMLSIDLDTFFSNADNSIDWAAIEKIEPGTYTLAQFAPQIRQPSHPLVGDAENVVVEVIRVDDCHVRFKARMHIPYGTVLLEGSYQFDMHQSVESNASTLRDVVQVAPPPWYGTKGGRLVLTHSTLYDPMSAVHNITAALGIAAILWLLVVIAVYVRWIFKPRPFASPVEQTP